MTFKILPTVKTFDSLLYNRPIQKKTRKRKRKPWSCLIEQDVNTNEEGKKEKKEFIENRK
jgi:hypothetical protein